MRLTPAPARAAAAMTRTAAADRRPLDRRDGPVARRLAAVGRTAVGRKEAHRKGVARTGAGRKGVARRWPRP